MSGGGVKLAAAVGIALVISTGMKQHHHGGIIASLTSAGTSNLGGGQAVSYARAQVGKPYCWGGTGPSCYDCSGLVMKAYGLGHSLRTSQQQWAGLPHVSRPRPGDLVFAPGSDGTTSAPGHVAIVIRGGRVIQAYATGTPIEVSSLSSFAASAGGVVGYARPGGA